VPGLIGSFANPLAAAAFDQMFDRVLVETFWCCFTWGDEDEEYRTLPYAVPQPFALAGMPQSAAACLIGCLINKLHSWHSG
jgi:hypothetical protein